MIELIEVGGQIDDQWDELAASHESGTIFHTTKWLNLLSTNQSLKKIKLGIFSHGDLVGIFPLFLKKFLLIKVVGSPFIVEDTPYQGPVIDSGRIPDLFSAFDQYMRRNHIHFFRTLSKQAYHNQAPHTTYCFYINTTYVLNISQSEEKLWNNLEGRCRTAIRKAVKSGVRITVEKDKGFIEEYYSILKKVYADQGLPCPNGKGFYYDLWTGFVPDHAFFLSAAYDRDIIAGIIMIIDRKRAYYLNGASKHRFRSLSPTNLLLWEAIRLAKEKGAEEFDFVGSDIPRLARFKKSFGGQLVEYSLVEKASSPWVFRLRSRYPYYKQRIGSAKTVLSKLPFLRNLLP